MEPTKPATIATSAAPSWLAPFISNTAKMLGAGFTVSFENGLEVDQLIPDDELRKAASKIVTSKDRMDSCRVFYDRLLGLLICEYAARHSVSFADAVDQMGLVSKLGHQFRYFEALPRMVQRNLPQSFELVGLTTAHFDAVARFAQPDEPEKKPEWRRRCHELLVEAAADPKEKNSQWIRGKMRDLQKEFGVSVRKKVPASHVMGQHCALSKMLLEWVPGDYATAGLSRSDVLNKWISLDAELVDRELVPDGSDPAAFVSFVGVAMVAPEGETVDAEESKPAPEEIIA